jgi:signal transduction histidine kinase/HPt (histidine-containing phosphotransfer) domain-containing protein
VSPPTLRGSGLFRKIAAALILLVAGALTLNAGLTTIFLFFDQRALIIRVQEEQAQAAADRIGLFLAELARQLRSAAEWEARSPSADPRLEALRLLREAPAVSDLVRIEPNGRERLRISRLARDTVDPARDWSADPVVQEARERGAGYGPVSFVRGSEPQMVIAAGPARSGGDVLLARVDLKFAYDVVSRIRVGAQGRAYLLDETGRLVSHPDLRHVLRGASLSELAGQGTSGDGRAGPSWRIGRDFEGAAVLSVAVRAKPVGWLVVTELPLSEAFAPVVASVLRSLAVLLAAVATAAFAALLLSRRMVAAITTLHQGAARIGAGDLDHRLTIRTGDELEALGSEINRMAVDLSESRTELEERVRRRTAELSSARDEALAARAAAELANQTKSRFLAVAGHELLTPINGILGVLQTLDPSAHSPQERRLLAAATAMGETLTYLVQAIFDLTRLETGRETLDEREFDLAALVESAVQLLGPRAAAKGLALTLDLTVAPDLRLRGDPVKLNRVLLNLLSNAIRFTEGGSVAVRVGAKPGPGTSVLVSCDVEDTGPGIAADQQERVFEEFEQGGRPGMDEVGSTGLGLAICRRIVGLMGGKLTLSSEPMKGSLFRLALPFERAGDGGERRPAATVGGAALDLLVVDDDPINRQVLVLMLQSLGHRVLSAASGWEAIEAARTARFDVVLLDVHMPDLDGAAVARAILSGPERRPRLVAVTADMSREVEQRLAQAGVAAILRKPVWRGTLADAIMQEIGPPELSGETVGPLDERLLADRLEQVGAARLRVLADTFRQEASGALPLLQRAAAAQERPEIEQLAHRLASAAGALGLQRLAERCAELERRAATADAAALAALASTAVADRDEGVAALAEWLDRVQPASSVSTPSL